MRNLSNYQKAQKIAKVTSCNIAKNGGSYGLYDKASGGWRGAVTAQGDFQGIAKDQEVLRSAAINPASGDRI